VVAASRRALLSSNPIVTDVERPSTAPSPQRNWRRRRPIVVAGAVVTVCLSALAAPARPAVADSLSSARARAAQITAQLATDQRQLDTTSQQYDLAQQRVTQLDAQMTQIKASIATDRSQVLQDQTNLRQQAVSAYMNGTTDSDLTSLFASTGEQSSATSEYESVASGNIAGAIDTLAVAQTRLTGQQTQLQGAQNAAQAALDQAASARQAAQAAVANQQSTLDGLKGEIATLVTQQQAAEQAASHAAFEARVRAATFTAANTTNTVAAPSAATSSNVSIDLPAAGGAARAIAAAQSQLGVPYRWGGESPGSGFDCSGLTQWAWGQAGVSLPRTAAAQYDAVAHVPLSAMEPGDLVFWGYGGISHVGIYVGGGDVLDAPSTGQVVQVQPIWNDGLVGAGRP
jgi:peptidoglycan DL-endopeptidase CwlO